MAVICNAPRNLNASYSNGVVSLSWDAPIKTTPDHYNVYRKIEGGSYSLIGTTTNTSYSDGNVLKGYTYYYYVTAVCNDPEDGQVESDASDEVNVYTEPISVNVTDNLNSSDSVNEKEYEFFTKNISDSASISDITSINITVPYKYVNAQDSISSGDSIAITFYEFFRENISDSASLIDEITVEKAFKAINIQDELSSSDSIDITFYESYTQTISDSASLIDEISTEIVYIEISTEDALSVVDSPDYFYYYNYKEKGNSIYSCRANIDLKENDYLLYSFIDFLEKERIDMVLSSGYVEANERVIYIDGENVILKVGFIAEVEYDKDEILGIKIGDLEYNGLNIEIEGGYMYRVEIKFNVNILTECVGGVYNES